MHQNSIPSPDGMERVKIKSASRAKSHTGKFINHSPSAIREGRKIRENPLPNALYSLVASEPESSEPESFARATLRTIRNKGTNFTLSHVERLELLNQVTAKIYRDIAANRGKYAARFIPRPTVPYCTPACPSSDDTGKPTPVSVNHHAGLPNPPQKQLGFNFTEKTGIRLNEITDSFTLDSPIRRYRNSVISALTAFQSEREYYLSRLIPSPIESNASITFGGSIVRESLAPNFPNPSVPFKNYLRRRDAVQSATAANWLADHRANWLQADAVIVGYRGKKASIPVTSPYIQPGLQIARIQAKSIIPVVWRIETTYHPKTRKPATVITLATSGNYLLRDNEPVTDALTSLAGKRRSKKVSRALFEQGVTMAAMQDIESATPELKANVHSIVQSASASLEPSELTDDWLVISRDLARDRVSVHFAPTMKSAEYKAERLQRLTHHTSNLVISKAQALSAKWSDLLAPSRVTE